LFLERASAKGTNHQSCRITSQPFLVRSPHINACLTRCRPIKHRHQLPICRAILGGNGCASLPQSMSRALGQSGFVNLPILADIIAKSPTGGLTLLVTKHGKPFTANGFGKKHRDLGWYFDYHHNRLPDWDEDEKDRLTGQKTHTTDANQDYRKAYKDYNNEVEKFTGTKVEAYTDRARRSLEATILRGVNFSGLDEGIFADLRDGTIAISQAVIGAPERVAAYKLECQKQIVRDALDEMEEYANREGITEGHPDADLLCQCFFIEVQEQFEHLEEQFEFWEDVAAIEEMRALDGISLAEGLRIVKRAKCAALAQRLEGYRVESLGEDFRLTKQIRKKQSDSQEDDATTDDQDSEGDQTGGKQDPGGPTGQEPNDTQPGSPPEGDKTGNSDDPDTGSGPSDPEEDLDNAEDPVDGHNKTPIDLQPMLARSVDDGIIGEDIGKGRRILAFYENTNTFLVEFRDGHLEVITEDSGSHIVARGLSWKPMESGPDDVEPDDEHVHEGFYSDDKYFVFDDDISEDLATDNRLVSGSTFPSAGQFGRRDQDIAQQQQQQQALQKRPPLAQRTFGPPGAPGTATNPGQQRFQPARPVVQGKPPQQIVPP
jgi:hypothetical protein